VREGNIAMDRGEFREGERGPYLDVLERWDRVFAVLDDEDYARMRQFGFIQTGVPADGSAAPAGTPGEGAVEAGGAAPVLVETLTEAEIEERLNARERARRGGEYAEADDIRNDLLKAGIVIEDSKTGTRWKRK
jgi:cysteinyl-tRNA synthetase